MCTISADRFVCESSACVALGTDRAGAVRHAVVRFLAGADADRVADVAVVVDGLVAATCEGGRRPVSLEVLRRPNTGACWLAVTGASATASAVLQARTPGDMTWQILDGVCTAWGIVPGEGTRTIWAELPLAPAEAEDPAPRREHPEGPAPLAHD